LSARPESNIYRSPQSGEPESLLLARYLSPDLSHTVIEVEAGSGTADSISRPLLLAGWRALLIESDPELFKLLEENTRTLSETACIHINHAESNRSGSTNSAAEFSLTSLLTRNGMPETPGLLILNVRASQIIALEGLDFGRFRPGLIVASDNEAQEVRYRKYDLLTSFGYRFAGIADDFSVWSSNPVSASQSLPEEIDIANETRLANGLASFDAFEGGNRNVSHRDRVITGWCFANVDSEPPPVVVLEIMDHGTNQVRYSRAYRYPRLDVVAHFGRPNLLMSGFRALVNLDMRSAKGFTVHVLQADELGVYSCDTEITLRRTLEPFEQTARAGLAAKFLSGSGIEIGALQRRLEVPSDCRVRYVDRMRLDDLLRHYPELKDHPLQAPHLIDDGEELEKIADGSQDFVIANHFFEHSENPIRTLTNLVRVLRMRGILFMAVPDKNYTFDLARPLTSYQTLTQTYLTSVRPDRAALYREWARYVEHQPAEEVEARGAELLRTGYSIHFNIWTADSLLGFLLRSRADFEIPFEIASILCCDNEVIVLLERVGLSRAAVQS
jgi:SAM-dependent methyltransferase